LFDLPKFQKIYAIHQGILSVVENPQHLKRKEKFTHCIKKVEEWILNNATPKHAEEIELNIQDIKIYLQEFFAEVQKINTSDSQQHIRSLEHQLLEYRYLFGSFFHRLHESHPEEKMLRQRFLFVDQYFESIENTLLSWRDSRSIHKMPST
jgi:hypothetical protein